MFYMALHCQVRTLYKLTNVEQIPMKTSALNGGNMESNSSKESLYMEEAAMPFMYTNPIDLENNAEKSTECNKQNPVNKGAT